MSAAYDRPKSNILGYLASPKVEPDFDVAAINGALDLVQNTYADYLRPAGIELVINRVFDTHYRNAHPRRKGNQWFIDIYGGMFSPKLNKYPTTDYAILIACHEVGHHLGGTVFFPGSLSWISGEGQADYFATLKCMRRVLGSEDNILWVEKFEASLRDSDEQLKTELVHAKSTCAEAWPDSKDMSMCVRSGMASVQTAINLRFGSVSIATPSADRAVSMTHAYPSPQCRLDTLVSGARCSIDRDVETSLSDPTVGNCGASEPLGARPTCWYVD